MNPADYFKEGSEGYIQTREALDIINAGREAELPNMDQYEKDLESSILLAKQSGWKQWSGFDTNRKAISGLAPQIQNVSKEKNEINQVASRLRANAALFESRGGTFTEEQVSAIAKAAEVGDKDTLSTFNDFIVDQNKSLSDLDAKRAEETMKASMASKEGPKKTVGDITFEQNSTAALRYADELEETINTYGTYEAYNSTGSAKLAQLPYQMAIAYAKIVDPTSVAREGEVESAKKYLIPIGMGTRDETALAALRGFRKDIEERVKEYKKSTGSSIEVPEEKVKTQTTNQNAPITKNRPPLKGLDGKREKAAPNNMTEEETTPTNPIEAANIFFNKNRSPK